ncbi:hypothetical protein PM082_024212 [Marasmius tenuissimus]|nr:hypothetical protein PM082_024212 [Marasmius tenuissimus]
MLKEWGTKDKVGFITCNNASSNDTFLAELEVLLSDFKIKHGHIQCFAHTINLMAKSTLQQFHVRQCSGSDDLSDDLLYGLDVENYQALVMDMAQANGPIDKEEPFEWDPTLKMSEEEQEQWQLDLLPVKRALLKIMNSPTILLPSWRAAVEEAGLPEKTLPRNIATCWNSTYDMIVAFLEYNDLITHFTEKASNGVCAFELSAEEWQTLEQLAHVLKPLKEVTLSFLSSVPSLATVIPVMDGFDQIFMSGAVEDEEISPAIKAALSFGKCTLNKYYALTDNSIAHSTSMILHPLFKTAYFCSAGWKDNVIDTAVDNCRSLWHN